MKNETPSPLNALIKEKDAARFLGVAQRSMVNYRNRGLVPWFKIGGCVRYRLDDLNRVLDERCRRGAL